MPPLKSEWFESHICAYFCDQNETDIDEQMRQNHFIDGAKQNQFHIFAHHYGWKESDFYEQMTVIHGGTPFDELLAEEEVNEKK